MPDPIEVNYVPDGDDWQVTVSGRGQRLTGKAPGLIAARDRADQLVEKLAPEEKFRTVVHLLDGDAVEFTSAYLTARLAKPTGTEPAPKDKPTPKPPTEQKAEQKAEQKPVPAPAPRADSDTPSRPAPTTATSGPRSS
jgi:hypothetical protein